MQNVGAVLSGPEDAYPTLFSEQFAEAYERTIAAACPIYPDVAPPQIGF